MPNRENYNDLYAFLTVAQEKSFAKASAKLGVSPQALSKAIKLLEQRLGLQLFNRTTRSVSLTQAGETFHRHLAHGFGNINQGISELTHLKNTPSGTVRINASLHAIDKILLPKLAKINDLYPEIHIDLISENRFIDIVAEGFDAGVRLGDDVGEHMIAVKIAQSVQMAVVGSPDYFSKQGLVRTLADLTQHKCIAYRFATGKLYDWRFWHNGEWLIHKPVGNVAVQDSYAEVSAAKLGFGLAYVPYDLVEDDIENGRLIQVLKPYGEWLPEIYLYYPHRNISPALRAVVDLLRV